MAEMTAREKERQRKLNKKPSVSEARKNIEAKRKKSIESNKGKLKKQPERKKGTPPTKKTKADRNPFNVRGAAQKVMDRRYRNQTTDSNQ